MLSRPEILAATQLSFDEIELVLAHLVAVATEIDVRYLWRPNLRDEGDNFVLEIAVAAWPCPIVTHNVSDFSRAEFRFPQVVTCTPGQLMQSLTHQENTMSKTAFPLQIHQSERDRGRRLAEELGVSENRLYAELIHDGLLIREQMLYMTKLRSLAATTARADAIAVLDRAADEPLLPTDRY